MRIRNRSLGMLAVAGFAATVFGTQAQARSFEMVELNSSLDPTLVGPGDDPIVRVLWTPLTRRGSLEVLLAELRRPLKADMKTGTPQPVEIAVPRGSDGGKNPLGMSPSDFNVGMYLPRGGEPKGAFPSIGADDAAWFEKLDQQGKYADIFIIGGHHVISEGFHDQAEENFIFEPSFISGLGQYPSMRRVFDHIKLAIMWGCNTMTNLEPHGSQGEYLDAQTIKRLYDDPATRDQVVGKDSQNNTYTFYTQRLAREYGPDTAHYEYTLSAKAEKCKGPGKYDNCPITDLTRVMPVSGLWDGTHRYDEPYQMKRIFPNAYLVLGYSSASPSEELRSTIFANAIANTKAELNKGITPNDARYVNNLFATIISDRTTDQERKGIIEVLRKNWTLSTYRLNPAPATGIGRPAGSITPYYPELDQNGVFNVVADAKRASLTPTYAPYEDPKDHGRLPSTLP